MDDSLCKHLKRYIDKNAPESEQFIFRKDNGEEITPALVYNWFRAFLDKAGIVHRGKDYGPRVHDFRHTFAVLSLNKLLEEGKPLYTALPILKDYLGHHDIQATEGYVRFAQWMTPDVVSAMNAISEKIIPKWGDGNEAQIV
jgi:integrase